LLSELKRNDIKPVVEKGFLKIREKDQRYTSYDYCYNYFHKKDTIKEDIELGCLHLTSYLASWGMYRGSGFLLREKSYKFFEKLVKKISDQPPSMWKIDVDNYKDDNINQLMKCREMIEEALGKENRPSHTLVTKIMMGVFGSVPALDQLFADGTKKILKKRIDKLTPKNIEEIRKFYEANQQDIDDLSKSTFTMDYRTGSDSKINYTKAKIIDMYFWEKGREIAEENKKNKGKEHD